MRRRGFLAGVSIALWPLIARAQGQAKTPVIGTLVWASPERDVFVRPFREGLREIGYVEGRDVVLDVRYARGDTLRAADLVQDLARREVNVIVAITTPAAHAAKNATSTIPIVAAPVADALAVGLVASLARPGGNITGVSTLSPEATVKAFEALRGILPGFSRVGFLGSTRDPNGPTFRRETESAAGKFGIQVHAEMVGGPEEFEQAFEAMSRQGAQAVVVQPIFAGNAGVLSETAARYRLPMASTLTAARAGAGTLIAYGPIPAKFMKQAAIQVDKILKGAKPADLPVEQPTEFALVVDLKAAQRLGLTIPHSVLARADEVIE